MQQESGSARTANDLDAAGRDLHAGRLVWRCWRPIVGGGRRGWCKRRSVDGIALDRGSPEIAPPREEFAAAPMISQPRREEAEGMVMAKKAAAEENVVIKKGAAKPAAMKCQGRGDEDRHGQHSRRNYCPEFEQGCLQQNTLRDTGAARLAGLLFTITRGEILAARIARCSRRILSRYPGIKPSTLAGARPGSPRLMAT